MSREGLTKRERVLRAFAGEEVDRRPFTFWHPFGISHMKGDSLSAAAISFAAAYGVDLLRLPTIKDLPLPAQTSIDRPLDLTNIQPMSGRQGFWNDRLEALRLIVSLAQAKIAVFEAIPEPLTALSWICPKTILEDAEQNHSSFLKKALDTVTTSLKSYIKVLQSEVKIDGIVIEIDSACYAQREPEDFKALVKPHIEALLTDINSYKNTPIWFQLSGQRIYIEPLVDLPCQLISWPHLSQGPSLDKIAKNRSLKIGGGINELTLPELSYQGIRRHIEEARDLPVALFCPGAALSANTAPSKLSALASFLQKRDRIPEGKGATRSGSFAIDEP